MPNVDHMKRFNRITVDVKTLGVISSVNTKFSFCYYANCLPLSISQIPFYVEDIKASQNFKELKWPIISTHGIEQGMKKGLWKGIHVKVKVSSPSD